MNLKIPKKNNRLDITLCAMFFLSWTIYKISLPALPHLKTVFQTSDSTLKLSISIFFISLGLSQLIWGAIAEHLGRKTTILLGLTLCAIGTIVIITTSNVTQYIIGRSLEGCGIGVISPAGRAILSDVYNTKQITKLWSLIAAICWTIPAVAPIIGGYILLGLGWRAIFIIYVFLLISFIIFFQQSFTETITKRSHHLNFRKAFKCYLNLLLDATFWQYAFCYTSICAILLGYYNAMPFWYVNGFHVAENMYAWLSIPSIGAYICGLMLSRHLVKHYSIHNLIVTGLILISLTSLCAILFSLLSITGITPLVAIMSLFAFSAGIMLPAASTGVLQSYTSAKAMVTALASSLIFLESGFFSYIESHLYVRTLTQLAGFLTILSLLVIFIFIFLSRKIK